jgi:hypothetical protein
MPRKNQRKGERQAKNSRRKGRERERENRSWSKGMSLEVPSPPAAEETGDIGREIESRHGIGW